MRFWVGQPVRVIDKSSLRGETGEIRRQGFNVWWVYLAALGREVPFDGTQIEPIDEV